MLKSLSFVPPIDVNEYFNELTSCYKNNGFIKICKWFKENYITGKNRLNSPLYNPDFWCTVDNIKENFPRTQNSIEAWHRRLKVIVEKKNCGVYKLIQELGKESIVAKTNLEKILSGERITKKKASIDKYKKIKRVIKNYQKMDKLAYLRSIAYNITLCN